MKDEKLKMKDENIEIPSYPEREEEGEMEKAAEEKCGQSPKW